MTTYVLCNTLVAWLCSRSQPGIKVSIRGLSGAFVTYWNISGLFFILHIFLTSPAFLVVKGLTVSFMWTNMLNLYSLNVFRCPFLHRTAGDTERRYHLRYYKTGTCVYETDPKGHCVKNGPHCAFAHGALDLRPPVYDIRELQSIDTSDKSSSSPGTPSSSSLEKDRVLIEDPRWNGRLYFR